jgi:hypothetical protein
MASTADTDRLNIVEQISRIEKTQAELGKILQDTKLATPAIFFQGMLATAALLGAGAALGKVFFPG